VALSADEIATRLAAVRERIERACQRAARNPADVRLIAVSKRHDVAAIRAAYAAGQRDFGENYVQELVHKADALADLPDLRFRLIGRLQRNKVKDIVRVHASVDTLDSVKLVEALAERVQIDGHPLDVLVQVNIGEEPQKAGVMPAQLAELVAAVRAKPVLVLRGLLAIPPAVADAEQTRPHFQRLHELARDHELGELSMGMSDDLEVAVEEGATMVRVGTAIFGPRA
jgi:pyridoxal phosphate enzyme (YggS family)